MVQGPWLRLSSRSVQEDRERVDEEDRALAEAEAQLPQAYIDIEDDDSDSDYEPIPHYVASHDHEAGGSSQGGPQTSLALSVPASTPSVTPAGASSELTLILQQMQRQTQALQEDARRRDEAARRREEDARRREDRQLALLQSVVQQQQSLVQQQQSLTQVVSQLGQDRVTDREERLADRERHDRLLAMLFQAQGLELPAPAPAPAPALAPVQSPLLGSTSALLDTPVSPFPLSALLGTGVFSQSVGTSQGPVFPQLTSPLPTGTLCFDSTPQPTVIAQQADVSVSVQESTVLPPPEQQPSVLPPPDVQQSTVVPLRQQQSVELPHSQQTPVTSLPVTERDPDAPDAYLRSAMSQIDAEMAADTDVLDSDTEEDDGSQFQVQPSSAAASSPPSPPAPEA